MKSKLILILFIFCIQGEFHYLFGIGSDFGDSISKETSYLPVIDIVPKEITILNDTAQFIVKQVKVLNRGGGILKMKQVSGSCYCSHGIINKNDVYPLDLGELRLEINKEGLANKDDTILFTVISNAANSPFFIKVRFILEENGEGHKEKGEGHKEKEEGHE